MTTAGTATIIYISISTSTDTSTVVPCPPPKAFSGVKADSDASLPVRAFRTFNCARDKPKPSPPPGGGKGSGQLIKRWFGEKDNADMWGQRVLDES